MGYLHILPYDKKDSNFGSYTTKQLIYVIFLYIFLILFILTLISAHFSYKKDVFLYFLES